jgi:hypothetical protein
MDMALLEIEKNPIKWRAVEFDNSQGSESYEEVHELFDWAGTAGSGILNCLDEWMPCIEFPEKKPAYPGETRSVYLNHGDYIVANNRGKVEVLTDDEFYERFRVKK